MEGVSSVKHRWCKIMMEEVELPYRSKSTLLGQAPSKNNRKLRMEIVWAGSNTIWPIFSCKLFPSSRFALQYGRNFVSSCWSKDLTASWGCQLIEFWLAFPLYICSFVWYHCDYRTLSTKGVTSSTGSRNGSPNDVYETLLELICETASAASGESACQNSSLVHVGSVNGVDR